MATTSLITGRVPLPSDDPISYAELTFTLSGLDSEGSDVFLPGISKRVVLVDSEIPAGFDLWRNTEGYRGTNYKVLARWVEATRDGKKDRYAELPAIQVGDEASYTLAELLMYAPFPTPETSYWMSITQEEYDAALAAVAQAEINGYQSGLIYDNFAAAEAADIPAPAQVVRIWHNGILLSFERNPDYTCFTDASLQKWGPLAGQQVFLEHWQIATRYIDTSEIVRFDSIGTIMAALPDHTDLVNTAFAEHQGFIDMMGMVNIHGQVDWKRDCIPFNGRGNKIGVGFCHTYNGSISHYHIGDLGDQAFKAVNLLFYAPQTDEFTTRSQLIRYPWAIDLGDSSRSLIDTSRIVGFINGLDMRDTPAPSNPGGTTLENFENGCFGIGTFIANALDFVTMDNYRAWSFMISLSPTLLSIFEDGGTRGVIIEKCDGFRGSLLHWKARARFGRNASTHLVLTGDVGWLSEGETITQATSGATGVVDFAIVGPVTEVRLIATTGTFNTTNLLTGSVSGALGAAGKPSSVTALTALSKKEIQYETSLHMDAPKSYAEFRGGHGDHYIYTSKDGSDTAAIDVRGGRHVFRGSIRVSGEDGLLVDGAGAQLIVTPGTRIASDVANKTAVRAVQGEMQIDGAELNWIDSGAHDNVPFVIIESGAQGRITGCEAPNMVQPRPVIDVAADNLYHNISGNNLAPHGITLPASKILGKYETETRAAQTVNGNTSFQKGVASDVSTAAINQVLNRSRGTKGARTKVLTGNAIRNVLDQGYTGTADQTVIQESSGILQESGGVLAGFKNWFVANVSGALVNVLRLTATKATVGAALDIVGLIDREFTTRAAFVAAVGAGRVYAQGSVVSAGGLQYVMMPAGHVLYGTNPLPDLPGFAPAYDLTPEHCGALGYGGTDDTAAFLAALATKKTIICDGSKTYAVKDLRIAGNEELDLNGATLTALDASTRYVVKLDGYDHPGALNGTISDPNYYTVKTATVSGAVAAAGTVITVGAIGGITADMVLFVPGANAGEINIRRIASVAGNDITLAEGLNYAIASGAVVYAGFGVVSLYTSGQTIAPKLDGLTIIGGAVSVYMHGTGGTSADISQGFITRMNTYRPIIAHEYIGVNAHDMDRFGWQAWGAHTRQGTIVATGGETSVDLRDYTGAIPLGYAVMKEQLYIRVNGVERTWVASAPSASQYTVAADGVTITFGLALTAGQSVNIQLYDRSITGICFDPYGSGSVNGAHKWLRYLSIQTHTSAIFDNSNNSGGLIHMTQVNFDGGSLFGVKAINTNKIFATHMFCGYTPFPLIIKPKAASRQINLTSLHTAINTTGYFNPALTAASKAITIDDNGVSTARVDGKAKVSITGWWGPDFSVQDTYQAIGLGNMSDIVEETYGNLRMLRPQDDISITQRAYAGTLAAPTAVLSNKIVAEFAAKPHNGSDFASSANMRFVADENHSLTQQGTRKEVRLTKRGATSPSLHTVERWDNSGFRRTGQGSGFQENIYGTGSPEGVVTAPVSSMFFRSDGGAGTTMYVKESGTGNTGWVAK